MYNIYIEEKKQKIEKEIKRKELNQLNYTQRYQRDQSSLVFNYNARVKDFILDMATSNYSLPKKNEDKPILNTRMKYMEETKDKIKGRRGFLFFGYKSEKERINEAIEYNKILSASEPLDYFGYQSQNLSPSQRNKAKCNQPQMRFKPKSNIDRVSEAVNLNYFGKVESEIINGQLSSIREKVKRRMFSMGNNSSLNLNLGGSNNNTYENNNMEDENAFVIIPNMKRKIPQLKYTPVPIRRIIKDYNNNTKHNTIRTHFKAVEAIALSDNSLFSSSNIKRKKCHALCIESNTTAIANPVFDFEEKNTNNKDKAFDHYALVSNRSHTNINQRYDKFIKHKNPNNKRDISFDNKADLIRLKQIAFMNMDTNRSSVVNNEIIRGKLISAEDIKMHEDKITIGNETFGIQSDIKRIAIKVLNKCNVYSKKNKNNLTQLEAGNGKLMATHGLSIKKFLFKYNLPG